MGETTGIAWTDHTFNPWIGCTKVSAACDHCYAESWATRMGKAELWRGQRHRTSESSWHQPIRWNRAAAAAGVRRRVFCASLADVFDNHVPEDWRADLWALIAATPHLDWLLLTKRPQNIAKMLPGSYVEQLIDRDAPWGNGWRNVWLGTTVETQEEADRRIPLLLAVPARLHWLSIEPMLGPVDLTRIGGRHGWNALDDGADDGVRPEPIVDWVICGGESGGEARPFDLAWAVDLQRQCKTAGIAFFMKQLGARPVMTLGHGATRTTAKWVNPAGDRNGDDMNGWPVDLRVREFPGEAWIG